MLAEGEGPDVYGTRSYKIADIEYVHYGIK
jgi:hypothetical protein